MFEPAVIYVRSKSCCDITEVICGEIVAAEKPEALWDRSAVWDIPGFSHRHGWRLPIEAAVVTLWPECFCLHHPKREVMLRPQRSLGACRSGQITWAVKGRYCLLVNVGCPTLKSKSPLRDAAMTVIFHISRFFFCSSLYQFMPRSQSSPEPAETRTCLSLFWLNKLWNCYNCKILIWQVPWNHVS